MSTTAKPRRLLTFDELYDYGVLLGRRQVDRLEKVGKFPKRAKVGERKVAWVEEEIIDHVTMQLKQRT